MPRLRSHPGEILKEEFLAPLGISARALAAGTGVPSKRVTAILKKERAVTADTAIRLGRYFSTTSAFWMNLQQGYELSKAQSENEYSGIRAGAVEHA